MAKTVHDVEAKLECGHLVAVRGLSQAKANRTQGTMAISAFCETCGRFQPTIHAWQQSRVDFS